MSVDNTTRRRPRPLAFSAASCSENGSAPASRNTSTLPDTRSFNSVCALLISPMPGKKTKMSPSSVLSAFRTTSVMAFSSLSLRWRGTYRTSIGNVRPSDVTMGASPVSSASTWANNCVCAVADMARIFTSVEKVLMASRRNARPRSVGTLRSCTSSKMTSAVPSSVGSFCKRRVRIPSVRTSIRVFAPIFRSSRVW
ncbi:unannotated protein [freshwater metagenome]|uniref:Unannotated protein n=1 Tax=freshwater metagenome TaxID=449393 RepID=A0A6J6AFF3_9ZZZZ